MALTPIWLTEPLWRGKVTLIKNPFVSVVATSGVVEFDV
jgi:hypothetical protein